MNPATARGRNWGNTIKLISFTASDWILFWQYNTFDSTDIFFVSPFSNCQKKCCLQTIITCTRVALQRTMDGLCVGREGRDANVLLLRHWQLRGITDLFSELFKPYWEETSPKTTSSVHFCMTFILYWFAWKCYFCSLMGYVKETSGRQWDVPTCSGGNLHTSPLCHLQISTKDLWRLLPPTMVWTASHGDKKLKYTLCCDTKDVA